MYMPHLYRRRTARISRLSACREERDLGPILQPTPVGGLRGAALADPMLTLHSQYAAMFSFIRPPGLKRISDDTKRMVPV
ncbi:hypothetical protein BaRGS_00000630 [Batillaria attramentaria]|uniref:Uncharacterized protein n=1 Tax=Batillaria attramentaria TaxID=370345 RepID=A0ABD0MAC8_9CAEN